MKKLIFLGVVCTLMLTGCHDNTYTLNQFFQDAVTILNYSDDTVITSWQKLLETRDFNDEVYAQDVAVVLCDALNEESEAMVALGYFTQEELTSIKPLTQEKAQSLLEKAKEDLSTKTFMEDKTEIELKQDMQWTDNLENEPAGFYETEEGYYEVKEDGTIEEMAIEDVLEILEIETTFQPDLSEGVIFPKGTVFQADSSLLLHDDTPTVQPLKSNYFSFNLKDYKVSGRIYSSGLDISVKKKDFYQSLDLENELSLSQFKVTADVSFNPFKDPHIYLRADYKLNDILSLSGKEEKPLVKKAMSEQTLKDLQNRLASLVKIEDISSNDLELLRFSFPVPGTIDSLKVDVVLKLSFLLNGEVSITFETSANHGFHASKQGMMRIQENKWSIEPYAEGKTELSCQLGLDLKLKKFLLADVYTSSGISAEGKTSVYFVNKKEKLVDKQEYEASIQDIEDALSLYAMHDEAYIDVCGDVDVYWFVRLSIGSQDKSLLRKVGFSHSYTPIKNKLSLLHIENHRVVDECTRIYNFKDEKDLQNGLHLNSYQMILKPKQEVILKVETQDFKTLEWTSSNEKVAIVKDGKIFAKKPGVATITVTDDKKRSSACVIIVTEEDNVTFEPLSSFCVHAKHGEVFL